MTFALADSTASCRSNRPEVSPTNPHAPVNCGFSYSLDTSKYRDGPHMLNVRVTDSSGNVGVISLTAPTRNYPDTYIVLMEHVGLQYVTCSGYSSAGLAAAACLRSSDTIILRPQIQS